MILAIFLMFLVFSQIECSFGLSISFFIEILVEIETRCFDSVFPYTPTHTLIWKLEPSENVC